MAQGDGKLMDIIMNIEKSDFDPVYNTKNGLTFQHKNSGCVEEQTWS